MARCPSCGAHREASDEYCPVCGETLTKVHFSEATGDSWYERVGLLAVILLLVTLGLLVLLGTVGIEPSL